MSIKNEVLKYLKENKEYFKKKYGVREFYLFGSVARGEDNENSDIDLMVEFENEKYHTFDNYFDIVDEFKNKFKRKIDLATKDMIKSRLEKYIKRDLISV
jgi:predicted nucleotidyltransferase